MKSPDAFRTISEVSAELDVPQHVLRFWETKFAQVKPLKRGGGRRYYRPADIDVIRGIQTLLYTDGYTIRGVQKVLRTQGIRFAAEVGKAGGLRLTPVVQVQAEPELVLETQAAAPAPAPVAPKMREAVRAPEAQPPAPKHKVRTSRDFVDKVVPRSEPAPAQLTLVEPPALMVSDKERQRFVQRLEALAKLKGEIGAVLAERAERTAPPRAAPRAARA